MEITVSNKLNLKSLSDDLSRAIQNRLQIPNPAYIEAERMGRWTQNIPRILCYFTPSDSGLDIPCRGFIGQLIDLCRSRETPFQIDDRRNSFPEVPFSFKGDLKPFQKEAVSAVLKQDFGTLSAPTGSGKTVMALAVIAERKQPTLIVVHTSELLHQWIERIGAFLGIPGTEVGIIGQGKRIIGNRVTVALVQTLYKCADEAATHIGFLIVDECHRAPSRTFTEAVTAFDSKYMLGLSATPWRRDRLSRLIYWYLGDLVHEVKREDLQDNGDILRAEVITRQTNFRTSFDPSEQYSRMLSELAANRERNTLIASDVAREVKNGTGVCLVLSDRKTHCEAIRELLRGLRVKAELLTGDLSHIERKKVVDRLRRGKVKVLVATGQLIGEGFDCKALSTLFFATPIRFNGRILQYLGRVLRPAPGKDRARVYDYVDVQIGVLRASGYARIRTLHPNRG